MGLTLDSPPMKIFLILFLGFVVIALIAITVFISLPSKVLSDITEKSAGKRKRDSNNPKSDLT